MAGFRRAFRSHRAPLAGSLAVVVVALAMALIARGLVYPPPPRGGIDRAAAINAAAAHVDPGSTGVISAEVRHNFQTGHPVPSRSWIWLVTFKGRWDLICTGDCTASTEWVAVDYFTGEWVASEFSYRAG